MADINWKNKCWVTTIFLVNDSKVLLTWNKNLQTWIPVGGHIEPGENPEEAIRREVSEEVGCDFDFLASHQHSENVTVLSHHRLQIEKLPHHNEHINIVFIGTCRNWSNKTETDENEKLRWFSEKELKETVMLENVRTVALEALALTKKPV